MKEANQKQASRKQLASLKLVAQCLVDHKLDATELAGININQMIAKLEKDILEQEQCRNIKRRAEDFELLRNPDSKAKQIRPSDESVHSVLPQPITQTQGQGVPAYKDSRYNYNGSAAKFVPVSYQASHGQADSQAKQMGPSAEAIHSVLTHSIRQTQEQGIATYPDSRYNYNGCIPKDALLPYQASHVEVHYSSRWPEVIECCEVPSIEVLAPTRRVYSLLNFLPE